MNMVLLPDGGRNPTFDEKFLLPLIEGLGELSILCGTATHSAMMTSLAAAGCSCVRCLHVAMRLLMAPPDTPYEISKTKGRVGVHLEQHDSSQGSICEEMSEYGGYHADGGRRH